MEPPGNLYGTGWRVSKRWVSQFYLGNSLFEIILGVGVYVDALT